MNVGVVGAEVAKFTPESEARAREVIRDFLNSYRSAGHPVRVVSGRCHLGGVDVWAVEIARELGMPTVEFPALTLRWRGTSAQPGFMNRNLQIARHSDIVHCVVVREYPPGYEVARRYGARSDGGPYCYHCKKDSHVKSGGCWTALRCARREWHVV